MANVFTCFGIYGSWLQLFWLIMVFLLGGIQFPSDPWLTKLVMPKSKCWWAALLVTSTAVDIIFCLILSWSLPPCEFSVGATICCPMSGEANKAFLPEWLRKGPFANPLSIVRYQRTGLFNSGPTMRHYLSHQLLYHHVSFLYILFLLSQVHPSLRTWGSH